MVRNPGLMKRRLLAVAISFLVALSISEISLRAFNYRPGTMDPEMYISNENELLPYKLRPNYQGYCAGREVSTDEDGYRIVSPSYEELAANKSQTPAREVLLLGDSGIFGFGLSDGETIASQLQSLSFRSNLNYRVRNIGVSGYTSWNELTALKDYLNNHQATNVFLLYMPNDLTFDNDYFGIGRGESASFARANGGIHDFTRLLYSHLYTSYLVSDGIKRLSAQLKRDSEGLAFDERQLQDSIDYSMQALREIQKLCDTRHIAFKVGIYRDVAYFADSHTWLKYEEVIGSRLTQQGIKWLIIKSHIDTLAPDRIRASWNDPHPGAEAAGLIANEILNTLND